ncbi:MAG: glycerophosphodiester phosphodiesterase [Myxococcota bacterium]
MQWRRQPSVERFLRRPEGPLVYAHRGAHAESAPENTVAAFERALALGVDGVELDVRLTRDGQLMVFHDRTLQRLVGRPERLGELDYRDLSDCRVDGHSIPSLDDALDVLCGRGCFVNIEVKGDDGRKIEAARRLSLALRRRSPSERGLMMMSTFSPRILFAFQLANPDLPAAFLFDAPHTGLRRAGAALEFLRPRGVHPEHVVVTEPRLQRWRRGGFVNVWTVDKEEELRRVDALGVDGVITNRPEEALAILRAG